MVKIKECKNHGIKDILRFFELLLLSFVCISYGILLVTNSFFAFFVETVCFVTFVIVDYVENNWEETNVDC